LHRVIPGIAHDKQREFASDQVKRALMPGGSHSKPVRHWDHWLHENTDLATPTSSPTTVMEGIAWI
jgi:hypothetical protein